MVNFVKDPCFVVVDRVVLDRLMHELPLQSIHHFNVLEVDEDAAGSAAGDVRHFVRLNCHLHVLHCRDQRKHEVVPRVAYLVQQGTASEVYTDVALLHNVPAFVQQIWDH